MRRLVTISALALILGFAAAPMASAQQTFSVYLGGFTPQALDSRGNDDVIFQNSAFLSTLNRDRGIDINQFNGFTFGGEYLVGIGRNVEAGLGIGFYQKTAPVVYTDSVNSNGQEIFQDLKLRVIPFSATFRFLPFGNRSPVQPYVGAGVGVFRWRYSETGEFIDSRNNIFTDNFVGSGSVAGPVVLGGVRFPVGAMSAGGEIRWQAAKADLPSDQGFAGSKLNLGGFNYVFTINFRF
jgi:Outer membrane protein beta-barrel domain